MLSLPDQQWAVIPAYNECDTVGPVVARVRSAGFKCLVIDDGSSDGTSEVARLAGADVVLRHDVNAGYAAALATGLRTAADFASCRWIVTLDADGQLDPREAAGLVAAAEAANVPIAIGIRPARARVSERLAAGVMTMLLGVRDPLCGLKAYRSDVIKLFPAACGRRVGMELTVAAVRAGHPFVQMPVSTATVTDRQSRYGRGLLPELRIVSATLALLPTAVLGARV